MSLKFWIEMIVLQNLTKPNKKKLVGIDSCTELKLKYHCICKNQNLLITARMIPWRKCKD